MVATVIYRSFLAYIEEYSSINEGSLKVIKKGEYIPKPKPNSFYIGKTQFKGPFKPFRPRFIEKRS